MIGFVHTMRPDLARTDAVTTDVPATRSGRRLTTARIDQCDAVDGQPPVDTVTANVLAIVAEKTGYPPEMLDLDLDMEADLGVDTVKQAETFAAIRAAFDIPRAG